MADVAVVVGDDAKAVHSYFTRDFRLEDFLLFRHVVIQLQLVLFPIRHYRRSSMVVNLQPLLVFADHTIAVTHFFFQHYHLSCHH